MNPRPTLLNMTTPLSAAVARHRMVHDFIAEAGLLDRWPNVLAVGVERSLSGAVRRRAGFYIAADPFTSDGTDLTALRAGAFDLILCGHFLEEIDDDRLPVSGLARATAPDGVCLVTPIHDPAGTTARLTAAGFRVDQPLPGLLACRL